MKEILMTGTLALGLAVGCGSSGSGSGSSSSGSGGSSGSGSSTNSASSSSSSSGSTQSSPYNTVQGTFTSTDGIQATLSGSFEGTFPGAGISGEWEGVESFDTSGPKADFVAQVSSPAGTTGQLEVIVSSAGETPAATTLTCAVSATSPYASVVFNLVNSAGKTQEALNSALGGSCTLTIDTPTLVSSSRYFAHGSLMATVKASLPDGGSDTGTLSASW